MLELNERKTVYLVRPVRFELTTFCSGGMNTRTFIDLQPLLGVPHICAMSPVIEDFGVSPLEVLTAVGNAAIPGVGTKLGTVPFSHRVPQSSK
jgi:hypothetical protein